MKVNLAEFRDRPRRRLLALLDQRGINYADFALEVGMAKPPGRWSSNRTREQEHRERARIGLRVYTHGLPSQESSNGRVYRMPSAELICRWAAWFDIDPGEFWRPD